MKDRTPCLWPLIIVLAIVSMVSCPATCIAQASSLPPSPAAVNMIQLLATPERYEGTWIVTRGFLSMLSQDRTDLLFLHEEDQKYALMNGMVLHLTDDQRKQFAKFNHTYVLIEGTVHARVSGRDEGYSGEIVNITRLEAWGTWNNIPAKN
jgi:hypothetical protein